MFFHALFGTKIQNHTNMIKTNISGDKRVVNDLLSPDIKFIFRQQWLSKVSFTYYVIRRGVFK